MAANDDFLATYAPLANDIATQTGLDPSVVLGIIHTETGGGVHVLGNNIFGISPVGPDGRQIVAGYPDVQTAAQAFVSLMQTKRYASVANAPDPASQAVALVKSGYNTANPAYASIVAQKALNFGKQLGYQDSSTPTPPTPPPGAVPSPNYNDQSTASATPAASTPSISINTTSSVPAPNYNDQSTTTPAPTPPPPQPAAPAQPPAPDYNIPPKSAVPPPAQPASPAPPAPAPAIAATPVDRVLSDPALQPSGGSASAPAPPPAKGAQGSTPVDRVLADPALQTTTPPVVKKPSTLEERMTPTPKMPEGASGPPPPPPPSAAASVGDYITQGALNVANAINAGLHSGVLTPEYQKKLEGLPYVGKLLGEASSLAGGAAAVPGALFGEVQRAVSGGANALIPPNRGGSIGPSLAAGLEILPAFGMLPEANALDVRGGAPYVAQAARDAIANRSVPLPTEFRAQPFALGTSARVAEGPVPGPSEPTGVPPSTRLATPQPPQRLSVGPDAEPASRPAGPQPAPEAATGAWRPVQPGEVFQPGGSYRMNQATGQPEVLDPAGPQAARAAAPQPASAGEAATPAGELPEASRAEALRNLERAVNQSAVDRAGPQGVDNTAYVQDIPTRPLASRVFNSQNALDEKVLRAKPELGGRDPLDQIDTDRNQGMVDLLRKDAGDAVTLDAAREARKAVAPEQFGAFDGETPVGASGLLQTLDTALNSPSAKRGAIKSALEDVRSSLFDNNGDLETLPSRLYGARQNLTDLIDRSKGVGDEAKKLQAATGILTKMVPDFDATIGDGAPKYDLYRQEYRRLSQPVNQQEFLQKYTEGTTGNKITDANGNLQLSRVQKLLNDTLQEQKRRGISPAKSLTDQQIQNIINVRNELAAGALRDQRASVRGSDSFQQFNREAQKGSGVLATALRSTASLGAQAAALHFMGLDPTINALGTVVRAVGRPTAEAARLKRAETLRAARTEARTHELLTQGPRNALSEY